MSQSMIKGTGTGVTSSTAFQLLDPSLLHGATSFYYDFFVKKTDAVAGQAIWQIWDGGAYDDAPGASEVTDQDETDWAQRQEIDATSTGLAQLTITTGGTYDYWYALSHGGSYPTTRAASGSSSSNVEFFVEQGRTYVVNSDGTHSWEYSDAGSSWTAFADGADDGFSFTAPASRRIRLVPTGAVNFDITSHKA